MAIETLDLDELDLSTIPESDKEISDYDWAKNKQFKDVSAAFKAHRKLEKTLGGKLDIPADDWDDDKWGKFGEKLRPKDRAAYRIEVPKEYEQYFDKELIAGIIDEAHKHGIPARWLNALSQQYINKTIPKLQIALKANEEQLKKVEIEAERIKTEDKQKWEEDCKKANLDIAQADELSKRGWSRMAEIMKVKKEDLSGLMQTLGIDTHSFFRQMGMKMGELFADAKFISGEGGTGKKESATLIDYTKVDKSGEED